MNKEQSLLSTNKIGVPFYTLSILFVLLINIFTLFLYDKYVSPTYNILDIQKILADEQQLKKFLNHEITENDYQIALKENTEKFNKVLIEDMKNRPNAIYIIKGAVITVKDVSNKKVEDATSRILEAMANSSKK